LLGPHLFPIEFIEKLPRNTMVYNLELMGNTSNGLVHHRLATLLKEFIVWDYGSFNLRFWEGIGAKRVIEVPIGYDPLLERIPQDISKDIDVLFIGSMSQRRMNILQRIAEAGYKVSHAFGVYGEDLDRLVGRAKLLLNVHFFEVGGTETLRLAYLWANKVPVVAEFKLLDECPEDLQHFVRNYACTADYDDIVEQAIALLNDDEERQNVAERAYQGFVTHLDTMPALLNAINRSAELAVA